MKVILSLVLFLLVLIGNVLKVTDFMVSVENPQLLINSKREADLQNSATEGVSK